MEKQSRREHVNVVGPRATRAPQRVTLPAELPRPPGANTTLTSAQVDWMFGERKEQRCGGDKTVVGGWDEVGWNQPKGSEVK